jgi:CubicO group peptidase (beta-lactamase class C family)/enterochelin esterase-like enzyme
MRALRCVSVLLVCVSFAGALAAQQQAAKPVDPDAQYVLGPDSYVKPGVPEGRVTEFTLADSKTYPGYEHQWWLYVPPNYDGKTPLALMVFQDGQGYVIRDGSWRVPTVLNNLIAAGDIPAMAAVFIQPGVGKQKYAADGSPLQRDYLRSVEYDTLTDTYANFILNDILPLVRQHVVITDNPEGRAISGISSGGIAAFTVAWQRTDQFRKVHCAVCSFTNIRGGNAYPDIVRRTPKKPIRVWQQSGENDMVHPQWGVWSEANKKMAAALDETGYDHVFVFGQGSHNPRQAASLFPDAMRWLWRDYPKTRAAGAGSGELSVQQSSNALTNAVQPFVDRHELAGAVMAVASRDKLLDVETVGYEDVGAKTPMRKDDLFWIASMSKPIAAAAVMTLVDEHKVSLDDPVQKYLPFFRPKYEAMRGDSVWMQTPAHAITIRQLLSHTSGVQFRSGIEDPTMDQYPLATRVKSYALMELDFEPGTKYSYSNAGVNTAARVIEVVTGQRYERFLDDRIFKPLRMTNTTFYPSAEQLARLAKSYRPNADRTDLEETTITQLKYPLGAGPPAHEPMPAGGLFSTAADMVNFGQMLLGGGVFEGRRVLSENAVQELTRKQTGPLVSVGYGLGFEVTDSTYGHGGAYSTNITVDKKHELVMVYMVQHAGFPGRGNDASTVFRRAAVEQYGSK